jgi:hypothetical protein
MLFVVAFNRRTGDRVEYFTFNPAQRDEASDRYSELLRRYIGADDGNVEVNIFESGSEETFKKTHSRYFRTAKQINEDLIDQLRSVLPE